MQGKVQGLVIGGLSGGSGKSVATVGLIGALREQGRVVPYKKGPDYIDAGWMARAAGQPCYNLDPYLMDQDVLQDSFLSHLQGADFAVIEGNRGLFDGVDADGSFSTAELALLLDLPLLLVVNCTKTTRTVAAMVLGCRGLEPRLQIAGVILNQIATPRHERVVRQAVEKYTGVPVVGIVPRLKTDIFPMRHLGVTPHQESDSAESAIANLTDLAKNHFDLARIIALMQPVSCPRNPQPETRNPEPGTRNPQPEIRIGILRDAAFQFYYQENLEALEKRGAELVMINALSADQLPPNLDGLYIGGGFPETSASQLAANSTFRESVCQAANAGLPIYAECGGLIFLGREIILDGTAYPMAGVFPVTFGLARKPQAHGYSTCVVERDNPFYAQGTIIKGHEFRYSTVDVWPGNPEELVFRVERGTGFVEHRDGLTNEGQNVLALYTHVLAPATPAWADGLVRAARKYKKHRQE